MPKINKKYWELYCSKKQESFINSKEYKAITEVLEDLFPNRWEVKLVLPDADNVEYSNCCMRSNYYRSAKDYIKYYMQNGYSVFSSIEIETVIYFPTIKIKNRFNLQHTIRDLYVKITFPLNSPNAIIDLDGIRATISKTEYSVGYAHSHLPGHSFYNFKNFCMGVSEMGCCTQKEFITDNKPSIYQFLFLLQNYLEYESIEGVPYRKIQECQNLTDIQDYFIYKDELTKLTKTKPPIKVNNLLKITNREEIELWLADKCSYKVTKIDGKYYSILDSSTLDNLSSLNNKFLFNFKNKEIRLKIDNYATEAKPKQYCHPKYSEAIIKYWENRILQTYIRTYRSGDKNTTENIKNSTESSEILVQSNLGS